MTVSSLWTVLDKANCGKPVGASEFSGLVEEENSPSCLVGVNPWNVRQHQAVSRKPPPLKPKVLAVDLSIWICESLTTQGLAEHNKSPALHLVFSRTMKLLQFGCRLVFVVEGKRRIQSTGEQDKFHRRRSGTMFWRACEECQEMLENLGVVVVRAKAEAEALCALLSHQDIVDGVITNDGDCFLFGAKVIYTKFSIENLANGAVNRYDLSELRASIDLSDDKDIPSDLFGSLPLSRSDLISFALLTGSDLVGSGLPKVGHKKAIRFIRKCQLDYPLSVESAAIEELKSWADAAKVDGSNNINEETNKGSKCCSRCCHQGSKSHHLKHGCEQCGTKPGEPCFQETSDDRFRKSLRKKALSQEPRFEPSQVVAAYMRPNDNQLPIQLAGVTAKKLPMKSPNLNSLLSMKLVVKGRTLEGSREHLARSVGRLLSRNEFQNPVDVAGITGGAAPSNVDRERPVPKAISKAVTQNQVPCYVVSWELNATVTDDYGEGVDGYEFSTVEPRTMVEKKFPALVEAFKNVEKERQKQGDGEKDRRQAFLEAELFGGGDAEHPKDKKRKAVQKRVDFFGNSHRPRVAALPPQGGELQKKRSRGRCAIGDEARQLMLCVVAGGANHKAKQQTGRASLGFSPISSKAPESRILQPLVVLDERNNIRNTDQIHHPSNRKSHSASGHENDNNKSGNGLGGSDCSGLVCQMGGYDIDLSPVLSNKGAFPPRNIYVRQSFAYSLT